MMRVELLQFLDLFDLMILRSCNKELKEFVDQPPEGPRHLITLMETHRYEEKVIDDYSSKNGKLTFCDLVKATLENDMIKMRSYKVLFKNYDGEICVLK